MSDIITIRVSGLMCPGALDRILRPMYLLPNLVLLRIEFGTSSSNTHTARRQVTKAIAMILRRAKISFILTAPRSPDIFPLRLATAGVAQSTTEKIELNEAASVCIIEIENSSRKPCLHEKAITLIVTSARRASYMRGIDNEII